MKGEKRTAESGVTSRRGTDEELIALLQIEGMSAVEVGVVFRSLQKKTAELGIEFTVMLCLAMVRKSNLHLQTNEVIGTSFR